VTLRESFTQWAIRAASVLRLAARFDNSTTHPLDAPGIGLAHRRYSTLPVEMKVGFGVAHGLAHAAA